MLIFVIQLRGLTVFCLRFTAFLLAAPLTETREL
ncbi:hypothetical protein BN8_00195 [Fibrisoma limi BUZ 3]|uniref:Uncharacterized protein n=1 Tax=Fibrisoma limi BUZ 3 TaxID=1185876 RepID=I2GBK4_9BACT|nr:hypothetical protein BN8_00195 [Fibrisoma limi BUZ 3]